MYRRAFTLIEVLVSVAIIGLLIALIIPNIDRSLSKNNIANDAQIFKAKLEEARLLSGSIRTEDSLTYTDPGGGSGQTNRAVPLKYYGILFQQNVQSHYTVVSVNASSIVSGGTFNAALVCDPAEVILDANSGNPSSECIVERVKLSNGVTISGVSSSYFLLYSVPDQQLIRVNQSPQGAWQFSEPVFGNLPVFQLNYQEKVAKVYLDDYSGKFRVEFND